MKIVILPGLDGTGQLLQDFRAALAPHHDPIVISYPYHLAAYRDLAEWLRPQLPTQEFILLAESFSGPLAVMLAASKPPGLRGLILAASFVRPPRRLPAGLSALARILPLSFAPMVWLSRPFLTGRYGNPRLSNAFRQVMAGVPRTTIAARLREVLITDVTDLARGLACPLACLEPQEDRLVPARAGAPCPPGILVRMAGPHFLLQTRAEDCAAEVTKLISRWVPAVVTRQA